MKATLSSDFTNVKVGDKVIVKLSLHGVNPDLVTKSVAKVTRTTFSIQEYPEQKTMPVYKKDGRIYGKGDRSWRYQRLIVWTQEIEDEFNAIKQEAVERQELQASIRKTLAGLTRITDQCTNNATLSFIKNVLHQAASEITDLIIDPNESESEV